MNALPDFIYTGPKMGSRPSMSEQTYEVEPLIGTGQYQPTSRLNVSLTELA